MPVAEKQIIFTYRDMISWEADNFRHELFEGEHVMTPSPTTYHQKIVFNLGYHLRNYVEKNNLGEIFIAPLDVVFHDIDVFVPDLIFVSKENYDIVKDTHIQGAPDLLIEVLSPATAKRDREMKYKRYAWYGVKEYWIVDSENKLIEVHDLLKNKLIEVFPKNQKLSSPTFPDLNLELNDIF